MYRLQMLILDVFKILILPFKALILFPKLKDNASFPQDGPKHEFRKMEKVSLLQSNQKVFEFDFSSPGMIKTGVQVTRFKTRILVKFCKTPCFRSKTPIRRSQVSNCLLCWEISVVVTRLTCLFRTNCPIRLKRVC